MRVAQVVPYFFPAMSFGGPAKVVYEFSRELAKNHTVTVLTSDAFSAHRRITQSEKIPKTKNLDIHYFRNMVNSFAYSQRLFTHFSLVPFVLLNRNKYDIYHFHDVFVLPHILLGLLLRLLKKPYVVSPHGILDPVRLQKKSLVKSLLLPLVFFMFSGAKNIVATSQKEADDLQTLGFKNVVTIYNGIEKSSVINNNRFKDLANNKRITLIFIGKLHPQKGLYPFLQALKKAKNNEFQLLIAGIDDGDESKLKEFVQQNTMQHVSFLGFVNEADKQSLYEISDYFIHPSDSEGFSISILEALQSGLPVLITKACNFDDVKKYNAGTVLPDNKVKTISDALKNVTKKQLSSQRKNTKKLITDNFTIAIMAENLEELYAQAIK